MDELDDDKIIDNLLLYAVEYEKPESSFKSLPELLSEMGASSRVDLERIKSRIKQEGIADVDNNFGGIFPTLLTKVIVDNGGYIPYINRKRREVVLSEKRQILELESLEWQIKVNKWLYRTKSWPFIISAISVFVSIISLIIFIIIG